MYLSIKELNDKLEERIIFNDYKNSDNIGKVEKGDIVIVNKKGDDYNIIKLLKILKSNWLTSKNKTLIYNCRKDIKIENYLYSSIMNSCIVDDIYKDIINKNKCSWEIYKKLINDKPLYIEECLDNDIVSINRDLNTANYKLNKIDLIIVINDEVSLKDINYYNYIRRNSCIVILTDNYDTLKTDDYDNIKYISDL